ncbi:MAG: hypothetical protein COW01_11620 [Bdellovibrionales bacterium CG12_big_fil_rev_8_21_14_0_65_38_15]|nr:MAG: hypothetical protein COW79_11650 [Bdellovibrionales bacterium CG22_combo_CG10-13_8_21_14_all_38_13]PIQ54260.1 MAG: hypothetical protein COW01_11620 [Bdellovibrionales bacterium CG12_big_fil_rev_8_21_14_0_65_38_15]PIR29316.1 MAG: hypothetical protein COV38_11265 [Bdellovibrionales bacterium CG11_big_fil_rev_8_21_14_0_20_38_13]
MRILLITLFALTLPGYVFSQTEHAEKLGLDLSNDSDVAVYMMMYQIGLKDRGQNLLGSHSCISLSRDNEGNTTLSFGMNTDAFATGTVDFNDDNNKKFLNTKNTLSSLFSFFDQANYKPQIGVRSYADPQNNIMSKYAQGGEVDQRYSSQLFGANSSTDARFNTDSKRRNYLLAYDRGQAFIGNYFPDNLKDKVSTTPYNSPDLEVGNNQSNSDRFACPNRRSIVVDMKFNPNFKVESTPGAFTPAFQVAKGAANHENILAAAFDAENMKIEDLPAYCRTQSSLDFISRSKKELKKVRKTLLDNSNRAVMREVIGQGLSPENIEYACNRTLSNLKAKCVETQNELLLAYREFEANPTDESMYALVASMTVKRDRAKENFVLGMCKMTANRRKPVCVKYNEMIQSFIPVSDAMKNNAKKDLNSSHFMDCFSNKLYYQKEFKLHPEKYLTPVVDLRDPQTGELKINLNADNIPSTAKGKGFICQACGNGLRFKDGKFDYHHRAGSDHSVTQQQDSVNVYNNIKAIQSAQTMYLMGQQKGLNVYIVKDCNVSNLDEVATNSQMVSLQDLEEKKVTVAPGDCIFKPNVINSCVHAPDGIGAGDEDDMSYTSTVPSFLTGKNLEITLDSNVNILNEVMEGLKDDYIETCEFQDKEDLKETPANVIDGILCENRGIHIPKPSFDSKEDCPDVAASIQR